MTPRALKPLTAFIAALGFVGAGVVGWQLTGNSKAAKNLSHPSIKTRAAERPDRGSPLRLEGEIAQISQDESFKRRMRRTIALADSIPDSEIFVWLKRGWFTVNDGFEFSLFTRILTDRLERVDPVGLARLRLGAKLPQSALEQLMAMATRDPEQVIALFREQPNDRMELEVLAQMAKTHSGLALERFIELSAFGFPESEAYDPRSVIQALATADPIALENALGRMRSSWQYDAKNAILARRLEDSFDSEIQKLYVRQDGWRLFEPHIRDTKILENLFTHSGELPPSWRQGMVKDRVWMDPVEPAVAEFWWNVDLSAVGFHEQQVGEIRKGALEGIAYASPEKALLQIDAANLSGSERKELIQGIFARAAMTDAEALRLENLLSAEDRQSAWEQLERKYKHQDAEPSGD